MISPAGLPPVRGIWMAEGTVAIGEIIAEATSAEQRRDWAEALTRWEEARSCLPDDPAGHVGAGTALQHLGRSSEADAVLTAALERFPTHAPIAVEYARVAHRQSNWPEALRRWEAVTARFPDNADGISGVGVALQLLGRFEEAESVLAAALERFQSDVQIAVEYARVAHRQGSWPEALRRWEVVTARFPADADGISGTGAALQLLGRLDDAEALLATAVDRFPVQPQIAIEYARVAHRRQDWPEALRRWQLVMGRFPGNADGASGAAVALEQLHRFDELEEMLAAAVDRFPAHASLAIDHARTAQHRQDWPEALRRWEAARSRFPDNQQISEGRGGVLFRVQTDAIDRGAGDAATSSGLAAAFSSTSQSSEYDIMMQFEGLGSGCEFGLVQRHFGAEPLGLLRWGAIPASALATALEHRFDGFANADDVRIFEFEQSKEYFFRDTRYFMEMHTFVPVAGSDYERVFAEQCRRARYLKEKLLIDLESPSEDSKIFVYKHHIGTLSDTDAIALHRAIRRYGSHTLLCMRPEDAAHGNGTVDVMDDGLLVGYIDRLSPTSNAQELSYASWLGVCRRALDVRRAGIRR
jgi:tetratricopeptide (TPR) repeat protein